MLSIWTNLKFCCWVMSNTLDSGLTALLSFAHSSFNPIKDIFHCKGKLYLPSANAFNLDQSERLSSGNSLRARAVL